MLIECYDVGGTKIKASLIESGKPYKILKTVQVEIIKGNADALISQIKQISAGLKSFAGKKKIDAVSIGFPGPVKDEILQSAPPLHLNAPVDIKKELSGLAESIFMDNDLNMAVMAEAMFGAKLNNFYLMTLSTGIGAGIVIDGKPLAGSCGEFGHDVLERNPNLANKCSCGRHGCWVAQASGYGIEQSAKSLGLNVQCKEVFELAEKGDKNAKQFIERARDYNAQGIGNMLNAFPAEAIIVMGSLALGQFGKIIPGKDEISKYTINHIPEIKATKFGEDIGIIGAYAYALQKLRH